MMDCEHHYCTRGCLYGGRNIVVTSQIPDANPEEIYQGVLCCKCHRLLIVHPGETWAVSTEECRRRWEEYHQRIDEHIKKRGPLGG